MDTSGCGDNHCAGFIAGLNAGCDLEKATSLANAAARLVATDLGSEAGIVDLEQTIEMMETCPRLP